MTGTKVLFSLFSAVMLILASCAGDSARSGNLSVIENPPAREVVESPQGRGSSPVAPVTGDVGEPLRQRTFDVLALGSHVVRGCSLGIIIESIQDLEAPQELGRLVLPGSVNGLELIRPGLVAVSNGGEGVFFVDITTPSTPRRVGHLDLQGSTWRLHRQGQRLLIAAGHQGVVIGDLRQPAHPRILGSWSSGGYTRHAVPVDDRRVLLAEGRRGLAMLDLSDPSNPALLGRFDTEGEARAVDIREDIAYVADFHNGVVAIDVSAPANMVLIGRLETADSARDVLLMGDYLFVAQGAEGVLIIDASDASSMEAVGHHESRTPAVRFERHGETHLFVSSDSGGMDILEMSDPLRPRLLYPD